MKRLNGNMDKTVISLMCENIKKQSVDVDEMARQDAEEAIKYIHRQYRLAARQLSTQSQSERL